jgi:hypothetical protein
LEGEVEHETPLHPAVLGGNRSCHQVTSRRTVYFVQGGHARIHLGDGESVDVELPDGHVMWHEPWTHQVENLGDTDIRAVIVEAKGD